MPHANSIWPKRLRIGGITESGMPEAQGERPLHSTRRARRSQWRGSTSEQASTAEESSATNVIARDFRDVRERQRSPRKMSLTAGAYPAAADYRWRWLNLTSSASRRSSVAMA
jgi:hypothetical protein